MIRMVLVQGKPLKTCMEYVSNATKSICEEGVIDMLDCND